jgi:NAD(P)-dependent dehydrogenase (short-subunit alcohol dehydrogenase family)
VDLRLDGKVAFITGASKGIGRCVADFLAREGCDVVITARTAAPLEAAAKKIAADTGNDGLKPSYWEMTAGVANAASASRKRSRRW